LHMSILQNVLAILEPLFSALALLLILRAGQLRPYRYLAALLATRLLSMAILVPLLHPKWAHLSPPAAYQAYFYVYWACYAIEALLGLGIIVSIFRLAMEPLQGLQSLGMMMFRWAGGISIAIAIPVAFGPHVTYFSFITRAILQFQQIQSVLTLCMLLFVCFAIHPMGLSYRSRVFGVSLGLGMIATTDLSTVAWMALGSKMDAMVNNIGSVVICSTLAIWCTYFALPEPKRRMIVLPTTSPFFRWNQISQVLGDEPGFVALGEVTADMFAPAEVEVMRRASAKMNSVVSY